MRDLVLKSGWETFVFAVPFLGFLLAGLFHLDELVSTPKRHRMRHRRPAGVGLDGEPLLTDPDGRPWRVWSRRKPAGRDQNGSPGRGQELE